MVDAVVLERALERLRDVLLADDVGERVRTVSPVQSQRRLGHVRDRRGSRSHGSGGGRRRSRVHVDRCRRYLRSSLGWPGARSRLRRGDRHCRLLGLRRAGRERCGSFCGRVEETRTILVGEVELVVLVVHAAHTMRAVRQSLLPARRRAIKPPKDTKSGAIRTTAIRSAREDSRLRSVEVRPWSPKRPPLPFEPVLRRPHPRAGTEPLQLRRSGRPVACNTGLRRKHGSRAPFHSPLESRCDPPLALHASHHPP